MADKGGGFDTLRCTRGNVRTRRPARARRRSISLPRSCFRIRISRRACSTSNAPGTCIRGCRIRRMRCSKNASPRSKAASARSQRRAARRRCTLRLRRCARPAITSLRRVRSTAARTTCSRTRCRVSASRRRSSNPREPAAFAAAIKPNTRLVFGETLGNPGLEVLNVPVVARVAHDAGLPLLIDSTFTTPYLMRPIDHGADLVLHSATKFLSGHGVVIGGVLVDGGVFDWEASGKFATLTQPYAGFHDLVFAEEFGPQAFITRARKEGLRDFGACMAPTTAFYILQGLETLSLRMDRHVANAHRIAAFLADHAAVASVSHPDLPTHPDHRARERTVAARRRRGVVVRHQRRPRSGARVHRKPVDLFAPGEHRRCEVVGDSSGEHDAPPHGCRCAARGRHRRRSRAVVGWAGGRGRSDRRSRPRARVARNARWRERCASRSTDGRFSSAPAARHPGADAPRGRVRARRRARSHGVGDAGALFRAPRQTRARAGSAGARPHRRTAARNDRGDGRLAGARARRGERDRTATIVGHSMGALVAQAFATRHPARERPRSRCSACRRRCRSRSDCSPPRENDDASANRHGERLEPQRARQTRRQSESRASGFSAAARGLIERCRSRRALRGSDGVQRVQCDPFPRSRVPTLVIVGEADQMTPARSGRDVAATIAESRVSSCSWLRPRDAVGAAESGARCADRKRAGPGVAAQLRSGRVCDRRLSLRGHGESQLSSTSTDRYLARFRRVFDFIDAHADEDLCLDRLSGIAAFSKFHFQRQFSDLFGISVHKYVRLVRLKRRRMHSRSATTAASSTSRSTAVTTDRRRSRARSGRAQDNRRRSSGKSRSGCRGTRRTKH